MTDKIVEQAHHDVAAVGVGPEEELAVRLEVLRADRHAVETDDVGLLAVDRDRVREVVLLRRRMRHVLRPQRRRQARQHEQDEQDPEGDRDLVAAQATQPQPPRPESVDVLSLGLFLPAGRGLKCGGIR
jgi:hypothetical protein